MELHDQDGSQEIHLTVDRNRSHVHLRGVRVHRVDLPAEDKSVVHGLPVTSAARTLADIARTCSHATAVVAADSLAHRGIVSPQDLAGLARARGRGSRRIRAMALATDQRAESVLETLARLLFLSSGLAPDIQREIVCRDRRYRADFVIDDLVIEVDGVTYHAAPEAYAADRFREHELILVGYRVVRFTWDDIVHRPDRTIATIRYLCDL